MRTATPKPGLGCHGNEAPQRWSCPPDQLVHHDAARIETQGGAAQERQDEDDEDELPQCSACGETCHWNDEADRGDIDGVLCNSCAQRIASEFLARDARLRGYYSADIRALGREVRQQLREADEDTDVASVTILSRGPEGDVLRADGAVVVIKGGNYVELFMQWAARNGMLTRGKPIVTGLVWRPEDAASLVGAADASSPTDRGSR